MLNTAKKTKTRAQSQDVVTEWAVKLTGANNTFECVASN